MLPRVRVTYLTTSYPRDPDDVAGAFVRDAVEHVRARGVETRVVSPASFRHFGLAYGDGITGNVRAEPWLAVLLPAFLAAYARAARRLHAAPTSSTRIGSLLGSRRLRPGSRSS